MKRCPICPAKIDRHKLMCIRHWNLVSPRLQHAVLGAWDRYRKHLAGRPLDPARALTAAAALRSAQEDAIAFVKSATLGAKA